MGHSVGEYVVLLGWVAIIFVMVRPGSQGPTLVSNSLGGVSNIVKASTGGGTW
jgi:hypothetical protein